MVSQKTLETYRADVRSGGKDLSAEEREKLLRPCLPPGPANTTSRRNVIESRSRRRRKPIRSFLRSKLHLLVYLVVHLIFGIYIRLRQTYHAIVTRIFAIIYYHHRTPELIQKDVKNLSCLPEHLSVILTSNTSDDGGLETLMDDVAELSAWCASAGIPTLSIYEKSGILKSHMSSLQTLVSQRLRSYFGSPPQTPHLRVHAPHCPSHPSPCPKQEGNTSSPTTNGTSAYTTCSSRTLDILLLSSIDGRDTMVDLARTLAEKSQSGKLQPQDITQDLVNDVISATTSIPSSLPTPPTSPSPARTPSTNPSATTTSILASPSEPDLLIVFGPYLKFDGYPPWQLRLTEIFCTGDSSGGGGGRGWDNKFGNGVRVEYQAFLRALWKFSRAEVRFGR